MCFPHTWRINCAYTHSRLKRGKIKSEIGSSCVAAFERFEERAPRMKKLVSSHRVHMHRYMCPVCAYCARAILFRDGESLSSAVWELLAQFARVVTLRRLCHVHIACYLVSYSQRATRTEKKVRSIQRLFCSFFSRLRIEVGRRWSNRVASRDPSNHSPEITSLFFIGPSFFS